MSTCERQKIEDYVDFIKRRANGKPFSAATVHSLLKMTLLGSLVTTAKYIRNFVRSHPKYAHDSVVGKEVQYDLLTALDEVSVLSSHGTETFS